MPINDPIRFDVFADRLFLSYLTKHAIWGGPAPIPYSERRWTPNPTNILITEAACRRFRETAERLAYAVPLEKKLGGVTFACKVRELYEATLDQAAKADGKASAVPAERAWGFFVARSEIGVVLDVNDHSERARPSSKAHFADGLDSVPRITPDRRGFFSLAVALPAALMIKTARATAYDPQITFPEDDTLAEERRVFSGRLVEDAAGVANFLRRLLSQPESGFRRTGTATRGSSSIFEIDESAFIPPYELIDRLTFKIDHKTCRPNNLRDCRRYLARAENDSHIRYHFSISRLMLVLIDDHYAKGTHWFGPHGLPPIPKSTLIANAIFDLQNHRDRLRSREHLITSSRDVFTLEHEAQLVLGPFLFRQDASVKILKRIICAQRFRRSIHKIDYNLDCPDTYIWV